MCGCPRVTAEPVGSEPQPRPSGRRGPSLLSPVAGPCCARRHESGGGDTQGELYKRCEIVARNILPAAWHDGDDTEAPSSDVLNRALDWRDDFEQHLRGQRLIPARAGKTFEAAYAEAKGQFTVLTKLVHAGQLKVTTLAECLAQQFKCDWVGKTFLNVLQASPHRGLLFEVAASKTMPPVPVLMRDWDLYKRRHIVPAGDKPVSFMAGLGNTPGVPLGVLESKVALLCGPSGSGKTMAALLTGYGQDAVCALIRPTQGDKHLFNDCESQVAEQDAERTRLIAGALEKKKQQMNSDPRNVQLTEDEAKKVGGEARQSRNDLARDFVLSYIDTLIPPEHRDVPQESDEHRPLVVVLDEVQAYPALVRGVIGARGTITKRLQERYTHKNPVYIVVAGTGVEGATHSPGSLPSEYVVYHVQPPLWEKLSRDQELLPPSVRMLMSPSKDRNEAQRLELTKDPELQLALQLVRNARACALFVRAFLCDASTTRWLHTAATTTVQSKPMPADARLVRLAATWAAFEFKSLNGLDVLTKQQHLSLMLDAVALQGARAAVKEPDSKRHGLCARKYGVVTDRGSVNKSSIAYAGEAVHVDPKRCGVRFEVEPAQLAVLLLTHGLGDRGTSAESFEQSAADFLVWAVHASQKRYAPSSPSQTYFERTMDTEAGGRAWRYSQLTCASDLDEHRRWRYPLEIVAELRELRKSAGVADTALDVLFHRAEKAIVSREQLAAAVQRQEAKLGLPKGADAVAHIVVNAPKVNAQDVSVWIGGHVLHVQCKLREKAALNDRDVFAELHKMGHRDWRCALAAWLVNQTALRRRCRDEQADQQQHDPARRKPARGRPPSTRVPTRQDLARLGSLASIAGVDLDDTAQFTTVVQQLWKLKVQDCDSFDAIVNLLARLTERSRPAADNKGSSMTRYAVMVHGVPQRALQLDLPPDATVYASDVAEAAVLSRDAAVDVNDPAAAAKLLRGLYPVLTGAPSALCGASPAPTDPEPLSTGN